ncbi:hypothetical protein ACVHNB_23255 [Streptomyces sp. YJ-C3]
MGEGLADWFRGTGERRRPVRGISTTGDKPWVRDRPQGACPVPDRERDWIERWLDWCAGQFGPPSAPLREVAGPGFVAADFTGTQLQAESLVRRVAAVMGADVTEVSVMLVEAPEGPPPTKRHQVGAYRRTSGGAVIELDRGVAARRDTFAALVAHELAHARLIGERRIGDRDFAEREEERLTDLVTVFLGMGVLTANAADDYVKATGYSVAPLGELTDWMLTGRRDQPPHRLGYLGPGEFGYALACWSVLRGDPRPPPWARHLAASVRQAFTQGLAHRAARRD